MSSTPVSNNTSGVDIMTFDVPGSNQKLVVRREDMERPGQGGVYARIERLAEYQGFTINDRNLHRIANEVIRCMINVNANLASTTSKGHREPNLQEISPATRQMIERGIVPDEAEVYGATRSGRVRQSFAQQMMSTPNRERNASRNYLQQVQDVERMQAVARMQEIERMQLMIADEGHRITSQQASPNLSVLDSIANSEHIDRNGDRISREALEQMRAQLMGDFSLSDLTARYASHIAESRLPSEEEMRADRRRIQQEFYNSQIGEMQMAEINMEDFFRQMGMVPGSQPTTEPDPPPGPDPKEQAEERAAATVVMAGVKRKRRVTRSVKTDV